MYAPTCAFVATLLATAASAQQLPCWNANIGTSLGLTDETISIGLPLGFNFPFGGGSYSHIQICDNGYLTLGASGGGIDWDPSANTLTTDPFARICPFWADLEPGLPGSGTVHFNAVPAGGGLPAHAVITWLDCYQYFGTTPHTFQVVLVDGGAIRCSYGDDLGQNTSPWLVGASPGSSAAPNPVDFSLLPVVTAGNATLHQSSAAGLPSPLTGLTLDWTPDGTGGYTITSVVGCADLTYYGTGCVAQYASFYEWFQSTTAVDLSNSAFRLIFSGASYVVAPATTAFVPPSATAQNLFLVDDAETLVTLASPLPYPSGTTPSLIVGSNGFISVASNGAALDYQPTPGKMLAWNATSWSVWRDFIPGPTGGGDVWFEETANLSIFTWLNVLGYHGQVPGTTPSTHQLQFDRTTGDVTFVFGQLDTVSVNTWSGGEGWVIGYSPGGASVDPGSADLSAQLATGNIALAPADQAPLTLTASAAPTINTTIDLDVTEITATALFGGILFGLIKHDPGIDLSSFGMPGCFQYNNQLSVILFFPNGATSQTVPFSIPAFPGLPLHAQAAIYDPPAGMNPLGATASNGVTLFTGQ